MVTIDTRSVTTPVGIVRIMEVVLSCIAFSLVASVGTNNSSYWAWCMFTWFFCFFMTLLILIMEFINLHKKIPISWDDFTAAFAMLATLMIFAASVIYPTFFVCSSCAHQISATVISCLCFVAYAVELGAGVSLPGIVAAKCGAQVTLSDNADFPQCLENCRRCCDVNNLSGVSVVGLTWGEISSELRSLPHADIILGSDVFYEPEDFEDVLVTLSFLLRRNPAAQFWTTFQERWY
ncbi:Methyltransferase-like protein 23 [Bagarius yarrelli]|uniref:Methyltransferase-like protein 23 n=1 Tax=Bagarius yarrelli TaxID=175774 RepID=A0A556TVR1_BAGYA|nr:Methyltransferase-like protein 23 [Bagarius yarrelli]